MAEPEIKITFKSDSKEVDKDLEKIEQKIEKMPKRIPLGQGTWNPTGPKVPNNPLKDEYNAGYKAMQDELAGLSELYAQLEEQTEKLTNSYRDELASLDETSQGYADKKKELEALIAKGEGFEKTLASQKAAVEKTSFSLQQLNENVSKLGYEKAIKEQNKMGLSLGVMSKTFDQTEQQISNYAEAWSNKLIKEQEKATKAQEKTINSEKKYQAILETTGMTYQELTQLYSQLLAARTRAQTPEQIQAIDRQLTAVRKNITLMGRESQLSGAKMIGAQTSVLGVMNQVVAQWRTGTLTLKGLTQGVKLFAKSTVVLAAIQFAWEGISWAMEKAKTAIFGAADAEEKAKQKAEDLAKAAQAAADNLANANEALKGWESDKIRADQAQAYADAIASQNDKYKEQLRLIDEATAAELRRVALNADGKEKEIALEKMKLQREKMTGIISEYDYQKKMIELETRLVSIRGNAKVDAAAIKEEDARKRADEAAKQLESAMMEKSDFDKFVFSPAQLAAMVAQYGLDEKKIKKYEHQYTEREALRNELPQRQATYKELLESGQYDAAMALGHTIKASEEKLKKLNEVLHEVDGLIDRSVASFNSMPEQIRNALETEDEQAIKFALDEYGKNYQAAEARDKDIKKRQEEAAKAVEKADQAVLDASAAKTNAMQDTANAETFRAKQAEEEMATLKAQQAERKADKASQKKIENARKRVKKMEFDYLQRQEREKRAWAEMYGEETPEGKRRRSLASVYTAEYTSRVEAGQNASNQVVQAGDGAAGKAAKIVAQAGVLAEKSTLTKQVDLDAIISVLDKAIDTKSTADNAAAMELYNLVQRLMTVSQKNSQDARKLKEKYTILARKLSDPTR